MAITNRPNTGCVHCAKLYSLLARSEEDLRGVARKAAAPRYQGSPPAKFLEAIKDFKARVANDRQQYAEHKRTHEE